ncbi:MAG: Ig-like domain-containing protein [Dehalococcoidia bacterium]
MKDNLIKICLAIVAAAVLFLAPSCTTPYQPTNHPPIITSLEAETEWTAPSGSLQVTCTASDPDGDELSYEWTTTGGNISGAGPEVIWTAPEEVGMYDITVVVDDGQGGNVTGSVTLSVTLGTPPIIQNLIVTAKEPKYLKETTTGYKVGKTKEYYIECIASDTDGELGELVYEWSCDGGEISGEGSMITWTAPNTDGDVTVTVKVFDGVGNMDNESIVFEVVSCSPCEFG